MNKKNYDFEPTTSVTFVFGPDIKTHERTTQILSELKKVDMKRYEEHKKENLEIQSQGLEKIIESTGDEPSLLEKFVDIVYPDDGFELPDVSVGYSIKDGNYYPTIVINVDKINSFQGKSKDDFLVKSKLNQIGSILGDGLNSKWIRVDISKPS
jgi:hypothetical protein